MYTELISDIKIHRGLFTRRYDWQYEAIFKPTKELQNNLFTNLAEKLFSTFEPNSLIKNIKGRDRLNVTARESNIPIDHELMYCKFGWIPQHFEADADETEKFCKFYLNSPFDHFESHDVYHKVVRSISGDAPQLTDLNLLLTDKRINLQEFRLGLDFFGQSSFANWFISSPVVLETLIIEASLTECKLRLQSEAHKLKSDHYYNFFNKVSEAFGVIEKLFRLNLDQDLKSKLEFDSQTI